MYDFLPILSRIKSAKADVGFTNEDLSAKSGVAIGTVNKILSGDTKEPKLPALMSIASALGVSVDYLIYGRQSNLEEGASYMVKLFSSLNEEGREKVISYATDLISSGQYKKDNSSFVVEGAL